jgi:hypothetical protein
MAAGDEYRIKAAELHAQAQCHTTSKLRVQFENLAKAYLRLAEQADRNDRADLIYEPPPTKLDSEAKR